MPHEKIWISGTLLLFVMASFWMGQRLRSDSVHHPQRNDSILSEETPTTTIGTQQQPQSCDKALTAQQSSLPAVPMCNHVALSHCVFNATDIPLLQTQFLKCREQRFSAIRQQTFSVVSSRNMTRITSVRRYQLHGGLCNQILSHVLAVAAALLSGATHLDIPSYGLSRPRHQRKVSYKDWDKADTAALIDLDRMLHFLEGAGITAVTSPKPTKDLTTHIYFSMPDDLQVPPLELVKRSCAATVKKIKKSTRSLHKNTSTIVFESFPSKSMGAFGLNDRAIDPRSEFGRKWPSSLFSLLLRVVRPVAYSQTDMGQLFRSLLTQVIPPEDRFRYGVFHWRSESDASAWRSQPLAQVRSFLETRQRAYPDIGVWYIASGIFVNPVNESALSSELQQSFQLLGFEFDSTSSSGLRVRKDHPFRLLFSSHDGDVRKRLEMHPIEVSASFELYLAIEASALFSVALSSFGVLAAQYRFLGLSHSEVSNDRTSLYLYEDPFKIGGKWTPHWLYREQSCHFRWYLLGGNFTLG